MKYVLEMDNSQPRLIEAQNVAAYLATGGPTMVTLHEATTTDMGLHLIGCSDCVFHRAHTHGETGLFGGAR